MKYEFTFDIQSVKARIKDIFSSRGSFLKELAQNAERAGSSEVRIDWNEETRVLQIKDNGKGFDEKGWESFFTFGKSGWDNDVQAAQLPFGMGATAMIFAADEVEIWSNRYFTCFSDEEFLNGTIEVTELNKDYNGTCISLTIKDDYPIDDVLKSVYMYFRAFTIPVYYNGEAIPRPDAVDNLVEIGTSDSGTITLYKSSTHQLFESDFGASLQGFTVINSGYLGTPSYMVHLSPNAFSVRVPDRDQLIEGETEARLEILKMIKDYQRKVLRSEYEALDPVDFASKYQHKIYMVPEIAKCVPLVSHNLYEPSYLPFRREDGDSYESHCNLAIRESDPIEKRLYSDPNDMVDEWDCYGDPYEHNLLSFLYLSGYYGQSICVGGISDDHWASDRLIEVDRDSHQLSVEFHGYRQDRDYTCSKMDEKFWFIFCDSYTLTLTGNDGVETVTSSNQPFVYRADEATKQIVIPKGCTHVDEHLVRSESTRGVYQEYEGFIVDNLDVSRAIKSINDFISTVRYSTPEEYLSKLLTENLDLIKAITGSESTLGLSVEIGTERVTVSSAA